MRHVPVIILGAPRSGTTILGEILSKHSELHYMIEPNLIWHRYVNSKNDYFDIPRFNHAIEPTRKHFEKELSKSRAMRLLEKTPQNCLRVPFVHRVFPNAKYIHIIRDGLESSLSIAKYWQTNTRGVKGVRLFSRLKEASFRQLPCYGIQFLRRIIPVGGASQVFWGPVLPGMSELVKSFSFNEIAAMQWRMCVEQATQYGRSMPTGQYTEFRLEDFDEKKLYEIMEFAQLSLQDEVLKTAKERFRKSLTSHRVCEANTDEIKSIMRWIYPTMKWLGQLN